MYQSKRSKEAKLRQEMVDIFKLMYQHRYIVAGDGNVTCKLSDKEILITPSGVPKGYMKPEDMVIMDYEGNKLCRNPFKPSTERRVHLEVYRVRPDVEAVCHAHPRHCIAFSLAGETLAQCMLPEVVITLGSIPTTKYVTPTSADGPLAVSGLIKDYNAIILNRHGSVTVGNTLMEAYNRLETIEHTAEITSIAKKLGPIEPLPKEEVAKLMAIGHSFGATPKIQETVCDHCNACPNGKLPRPGSLTNQLKAELNRIKNSSNS